MLSIKWIESIIFTQIFLFYCLSLYVGLDFFWLISVVFRVDLDFFRPIIVFVVDFIFWESKDFLFGIDSELSRWVMEKISSRLPPFFLTSKIGSISKGVNISMVVRGWLIVVVFGVVVFFWWNKVCHRGNKIRKKWMNFWLSIRRKP